MLAGGTPIRDPQDVTKLAAEAPLIPLLRSLQFIVRTGGHCQYPYSVMHHHLFGAQALLSSPEIAPEKKKVLARAWLVHDLHEAVTNDVVATIKCDCVRGLQAKFDEGLLLRKDLLIQGDLLRESLAAIKKLDKTIRCEEFAYFGLIGWGTLPEATQEPRPIVVNAIKAVMAYARRGTTQPFGRATLVPYRLYAYLIRADVEFAYVLEGLEESEKVVYDGR